MNSLCNVLPCVIGFFIVFVSVFAGIEIRNKFFSQQILHPSVRLCIDEIVEEAIKKPSLEEALSYICVWENTRVITQVIDQKKDSWETCFQYLIGRTMKTYMDRNQLTIISMKDRAF